LNVLRRAAPWAGGATVGGGLMSLPHLTKDPTSKSQADIIELKIKEQQQRDAEDAEDPGFFKALSDSSHRMAGAPSYDVNSSGTYQLGHLAGRYGSGYIGDLVRMMRDNPLNAGAAGTVLGGGAGLLWNLLTGSQNSALSDAVKGALLGGAGATGLHGLGAWSRGVPNFGFGKYDPSGENISDRVEHWFKDPRKFFTSHPSGGWSKKSSFKKTFKKKASSGGWGSREDGNGPFEMTLSNIYRSGYPPRVQAALAGEVGRLSSHKASLLQRLLAGATGATAVYLIAKFLFNMGSRSTVISTILGGIMGSKSQNLTGIFR
jgi:hypothetical protein